MSMKLSRGILLICATLALPGCLLMNYYDGPRRSDADVAAVYLHGTGGWPLHMYKINGQGHPFGFMTDVAYIPPGEYAFRFHSDETDFDDEVLTGFVTFNVNLKAGYSYFVVANPDPDSDSDTACIFEELRNDPATLFGPREPQDKSKPLQCGSLEWKVWK